MHSITQRGNALISFFGSVAAVLCILTSSTDLVHRSNVAANVSLDQVKRLMRTQDGKEQAFITFSMDADLRSAFSWNTKQLFVYLQAEYVTEKNKVNQVVIWDAIIRSKDQAVIKVKQHKPKYALIDRFDGLRGTPVNLTLTWNVMPRVGYLYTRSKSFNVGKLPDSYV